MKVKKKPAVLFETEGTYPYKSGGVSVWCDVLVRELSEYNFYVYAVTGTPNVQLKYDLPPNVMEVQIIPLWGADDPMENTAENRSVLEISLCKKKTTSEVIESVFIPAMLNLFEAMFIPHHNVLSIAEQLAVLHYYFTKYDYKKSFKSKQLWTVFKDFIEDIMRSNRTDFYDKPSIGDLTNCLRMLYHYLIPLLYPVPKTDITHTSIAGLCGISSIISKIEYDTPLIVTDHGVYLRERYLAISRSEYTLFSKKFLIRLSKLISQLCYQLADQISPVCHYNEKWEIELNAPQRKIKTIYNGVDPDYFYPGEKPESLLNTPTVVAAANVYPLKDIKTMIRACAEVVKAIPQVRFIVYGSLTCDENYVQECRDLIKKLNLPTNFKFAGYCTDKSALYHSGDISLITSISEGFPYALIESMACGLPVIATDVGGVSEALSGVGILVRPHDVDAISKAIITLLNDQQLRQKIGKSARAKVLRLYKIDNAVEAYRKSYRALIEGRIIDDKPLQALNEQVV